nr:MAG TPA: hypothetical protein [Caudoviricetes sp.]
MLSYKRHLPEFSSLLTGALFTCIYQIFSLLYAFPQ